MTEQLQFQAEVSRLLDIVTNALYTEREIFLRELISNASDACDRLRYEAIAKPDLASGDTDYKIQIDFDTDARTVTVSDNGIGMDRDALVKNLGTIAHSGTRALMESLDNGAKKDANLIGQFGVGFYAAFMVAEKVDVLSRRAGEEKAWIWSSDGRGSYSVDEALKDERGTTITLHIKDDASEFLIEDRLKNVITKYSNHISFPIHLGEVAVNSGAALWMKSQSDITEDQYKEFYRGVSDTNPLDEPWEKIHWHAEGTLEYHNMLFVPAMKPFDLYDPKRHHGVKLYVKRVFINQGLETLIPPFLRFVKGVVDCEDLPLNISRETLQANPVISKVSSAIVRKVLSALEKRAKDDIEDYANFWGLFGPVVKEGLYDAHTHREQLCKVVRFWSSENNLLVSLDDYVERMKDGQEYIYYLSAPTYEAAQNSPQLEAFKAKGVEVLFMTDTIDEFWLPIQGDYQGKKFKSVTRGDTELDTVKSPAENDNAEETPEDSGVPKLIDRLKTLLKDEVKDVKVSGRLVDSPVCLVAPDMDVDINMQRILQKHQAYDGKHTHVLEINAKHPVILRLEDMAANDESDAVIQETALLLLDQARIIEGEPLKNPKLFVERMSRAIEKGLV